MAGNILNRHSGESGISEELPLMEQSLIAIVGNELKVLNRDLEQGNEAGAKACFSLISRLYDQSRSTRSSISEAGTQRLSRIFTDADHALRSWSGRRQPHYLFES